MLMLASCGGTSDDESGSPVAFSTTPSEMTFTGAVPVVDANGNPVTDATGAAVTVCGGGTAKVIINGGVAPYSVDSDSPDVITLNPTSVGAKGGSFNVVVAAGTCLGPGNIVVKDALGKVATIKVTTKKS